jgi:vacuolar-type H+-ATPase subunit H
MAKEALMKIKEAEGEAAEVLRAAAEEAKAIAGEAAKLALEKKDSAIKEALRQKQTILENAEKEARESCAPAIAEGDLEIEKILAPSPEKFEQAVNTVIERILHIKWQ